VAPVTTVGGQTYDFVISFVGPLFGLSFYFHGGSPQSRTVQSCLCRSWVRHASLSKLRWVLSRQGPSAEAPLSVRAIVVDVHRVSQVRYGTSGWLERICQVRALGIDDDRLNRAALRAVLARGQGL
jgi:hypothetical protein